MSNHPGSGGDNDSSEDPRNPDNQQANSQNPISQVSPDEESPSYHNLQPSRPEYLSRGTQVQPDFSGEEGEGEEEEYINRPRATARRQIHQSQQTQDYPESQHQISQHLSLPIRYPPRPSAYAHNYSAPPFIRGVSRIEQVTLHPPRLYRMPVGRVIRSPHPEIPESMLPRPPQAPRLSISPRRRSIYHQTRRQPSYDTDEDDDDDAEDDKENREG